MIVAMFAILYFMMIRPENKRKKQAQEMRDNLKKGDVITTIGGIIGKIVMVNKCKRNSPLKQMVTTMKWAKLFM